MNAAFGLRLAPAASSWEQPSLPASWRQLSSRVSWRGLLRRRFLGGLLRGFLCSGLLLCGHRDASSIRFDVTVNLRCLARSKGTASRECREASALSIVECSFFIGECAKNHDDGLYDDAPRQSECMRFHLWRRFIHETAAIISGRESLPEPVRRVHNAECCAIPRDISEMRMTEQDRTSIAARVAVLEARTGTQVVTAVVGKSDSYPEAPWKAFALGAAAAALLACRICRSAAGGEPAESPIQRRHVLVILGSGAILALLAIVSCAASRGCSPTVPGARSKSGSTPSRCFSIAGWTARAAASASCCWSACSNARS